MGRELKKRTFRFTRPNVSFYNFATFRFADYKIFSEENPLKDIDGKFIINETGGGTIRLTNKKAEINPNALIEELFHAYQHENRSGYAVGEFNREFEAKTFVTAVGIEGGFGFIDYPNMAIFQHKKIDAGVYQKDNQIISIEAVKSNSFLKDYTDYANAYAQQNIAKKIGGWSYHQRTTVAPYSLQKVITEAYQNKKR